MADRARAERFADTLFAHLPVKPAAVTSSDSCVVRPPDLWHYNEYQFSCHLDEIRYVPVDGDLLPLLVKIDTAALADSTTSATEPLQNVQYYFAHGGRVDGLQESKPRLVYSGKLRCPRHRLARSGLPRGNHTADDLPGNVARGVPDPNTGGGPAEARSRPRQHACHPRVTDVLQIGAAILEMTARHP